MVSRACTSWLACGVVNSICVYVSKSLVGLIPRSMLMIGHLFSVVTLHQVVEELERDVLS